MVRNGIYPTCFFSFIYFFCLLVPPALSRFSFSSSLFFLTSQKQVGRRSAETTCYRELILKMKYLVIENYGNLGSD